MYERLYKQNVNLFHHLYIPYLNPETQDSIVAHERIKVVVFPINSCFWN